MQTTDNKKLNLYKIVARLTGLLVCSFFLFFIIGEGLPDIVYGRSGELIPFLPLLLIPVAGYIVAWFRPWGGGLLMISGSIMLLIYFLILGDVKIAFVYSFPFLLSGLLFLLQVNMFNRLKNKR